MAEQPGQEGQKKGFFSVLGGSLLLKIILLVGILIIVSIVFFGLPLTPYDILMAAAKFLVGIFLIYLAIKGVQALFFNTVFSPTQSFKEKVIEIAKLTKPFNVGELWLRGEDMRMGAKIGNIKGIAFVPHLSSVPETAKNKEGIEESIYIDAKDIFGNTLKDEKTGKNIQTPKMKILTEKSGDWLFVVKIGWFILGKELLVRAAPIFCSELANRVYIKTVNLMPCGDYYYPNQQYQTDISQIMAQQKTEAMTETYLHFMDLMASVASAALRANPEIQKEEFAKTEQLASQNQGFLMGRTQ